jgi:hypothetical protein
MCVSTKDASNFLTNNELEVNWELTMMQAMI